ncbi:succinate dehydrogenase cytochrome b subunit [Pontibacter sp. FD36]|uniref:Succinate dehydrogenase / fumarate reductase cytochrome b subunit n=1 Tax=Pontibacter lucknowensis TaxID=1077936 RepID=A0A1N6Z6E1_9BACT|nr:MULTISPECIES: succinate dehydrogenase cytochrome b subunit [Pontibacter]EJF11708.1 succinate dehydrogenase (or fumarate reductase) cytochrome b subunit, b558 family protein [Pontibacter sp. BAB1700]MBF8963046.1 succinate dehydrogenase cytochrome b subunit [Pontibacter sp. FD36]SIR22375.1 succinate dehydrogenase / fumarate reductase cytochrome b subunit [Pontibacter lucknowensis]
MNWFTKTFSSTIGRKIIMSITGLFLCSFLVVHLIGNLTLFKGDDGVTFNLYSHFMANNPIIRTMEIVLVLGFVFHIYDALVLTRRNKAARPVGYAENHPQENSTWSSRNMGLLGTVILVFLIIHLWNFFVPARFGAAGGLEGVVIENVDYDNLYLKVVQSFQIWWYVLIYVISMIALAYHLIHGFQSAFQSLGLTHKKYTPFIKTFGVVFSIAVCFGFAIIPIYFFFAA